MKYTRRNSSEANTSSMADIAFLLLIFFLVSTTIIQEKGLMLKLPPDAENQTEREVNDRNVFKVLVNSNNDLLVEDRVRHEVSGLSEEVKIFVLNYGNDPNSSENPEKAIISLKTNRGTDYFQFIAVLDELKKAYYEIYGERVNLSGDEYRKLKRSDPRQAELYYQGRAGIPMNISIAEPN